MSYFLFCIPKLFVLLEIISIPNLVWLTPTSLLSKKGEYMKEYTLKAEIEEEVLKGKADIMNNGVLFEFWQRCLGLIRFSWCETRRYAVCWQTGYILVRNRNHIYSACI